MEINNLSLLTYGAIGATCVILAAVTIFDNEAYEETSEPGTDSMNLMDSLKSSFSTNKSPDNEPEQQVQSEKEPSEEEQEEPVEEEQEEPVEEEQAELEEPPEEESAEPEETAEEEPRDEYQQESDENEIENEPTAPPQSTDDDDDYEKSMDKRGPGYGGKTKSSGKSNTKKRTMGKNVKQTKKNTKQTNKKSKSTLRKK